MRLRLLKSIRVRKQKTNVSKVIHSTAPVRAIENQLIELLGTKVKLKPGQVGGAIEILYFSDDDLERILDLLQSLEEVNSEPRKIYYYHCA